MSEKKGERKRSGEAKSAAEERPAPGSSTALAAGKSGAIGGPSPSFEVALARLEKIVQDLEGGELTLEETLVRYEEGARLAADCARLLEEAEQRIRVLSSANDVASTVEAGETDGETEGEQDGLPF